MTRSSNHPEADYTINDMGVPDKLYGSWETFEDWERTKLADVELDDNTPL